MIETCSSLGMLGSSIAFAVAAAVGIFFGFFLEQAGLGSSRRLTGVFFLRDMTVPKVMLTAVVTAMVGLGYLTAFGLLGTDSLLLPATAYGAQVVGGLLVGAGFAAGGWCPGTAVAGIASGRLDAFLFFAGALAGSILFNEMYPLTKPLASLGGRGARFAYETLNLSAPTFVFLFTIASLICFRLCEGIEKRRGMGVFLDRPFLALFSLALIMGSW